MTDKKNQHYECTIIVRPNLSEQQAKNLAKDLYPFIESDKGSITSAEYWGFKTLAYKVKKNTKAHYISIRFESQSLEKLYEHLKFNQSILRFRCFKYADALQSPSPLFVSDVDSVNTITAKDDSKSAPISTDIDYKNIRLIKKHLTEHGKIVPSHMGRTTNMQQSLVAKAIKRAREMALLPYDVK